MKEEKLHSFETTSQTIYKSMVTFLSKIIVHMSGELKYDNLGLLKPCVFSCTSLVCIPFIYSKTGKNE